MKNTLIYTAILGLIFTLTSCEKVLMKPNPETNNEAIFSEYVTLVKEKYAMLDFKSVDIDQLATTVGAGVNENLTDIELFEKLGEITLALKDGHSNINIGAEEFIGYDFTEGYPKAFDKNILVDNYIGSSINPGMKTLYDENNPAQAMVIYGKLIQDNQIAYMFIPSWDANISDDQIETIFASFVNAKGLIIDIRQNTGGFPDLATKFASYLVGGDDVYTGFERFKTGPGEDEFSDSKMYLKQAKSDVRYNKPVAVLTDRFCYSASTTFLYSVNPLVNVTTIGQRSGGGSGSVADGYLANGWQWSLSTSEFIDHLGNHLDNGIEPDLIVSLDTLVITQDEIIERAILELQ